MPSSNGWHDRLAEWSVYAVALLISAVFLWILGDIARGGMTHLSLEFLSRFAAGGRPCRRHRFDPCFHHRLSLLIALIVALPLGWTTAGYLAEYVASGSRFGDTVRYSLQILAAVPSIVFGLFGNAFFSIYLGHRVFHPYPEETDPGLYALAHSRQYRRGGLASAA